MSFNTTFCRGRESLLNSVAFSYLTPLVFVTILSVFGGVGASQLSTESTRVEVDTAEQRLKDLADILHERLAIMREVAFYKYVHDLPITDSDREAAQLESIVSAARRLGIADRAFASQMQLQFGLAKAVQEYWIKRWEKYGPPPGHPKDLQQFLRYQIDRLNKRFIDRLYLALPHLLETEKTGLYLDLGSMQSYPLAPELVLQLEDAFAEIKWLKNGEAPFLQRVRASRILRVGVTGDYKPFNYTEQGVYKGIDIDMAKQFARHLNVRLVLVPTSWPTLYQDMEASKFDIAMTGVQETKERRRVGHFSDSYHRGGKTAIGRCEDKEKFRRKRYINNSSARIIVNPGGTNEKAVYKHFPKADVRIFPDNRIIFDEIVGNNADIMITDLIEARLQTREKDSLCILLSKPVESTRKAYWLQDDDDFAEETNVWLTRMRRSGQIENAYIEHYGTAWEGR